MDIFMLNVGSAKWGQPHAHLCGEFYGENPSNFNSTQCKYAFPLEAFIHESRYKEKSQTDTDINAVIALRFKVISVFAQFFLTNTLSEVIRSCSLTSG